MTASRCALCITVCLYSLNLLNGLQAAPPKITSLYPAGVQRGSQVEVKLNGAPGALPLQAWCESDLLTITIAEDGKTATFEADPALSQQLLGVRFFNSEGSNDLLPFTIGVLPELTEVEPNDDLTSKLEVTLPTLVNGTLSKSGEVDTFPISLEVGQTLVASIDANRLLDSPMDGVLQVLSPLGFVVAQNDDDHGVDPLIAYTAQERGIHFVRLFAFPAAPNSTINYAGGTDYVYRLTLTTDEFVHHVITDQNPQNVTTAGWNLKEMMMSPEAVVKLPGLHLLQTPDKPTASDEPLTLPALVHQRIEATGQRDRFLLPAKKGDTYQLQVRSRELGSQLDPVLQILSGEGKVLKESDDIARDNPDVTLDWKAPSDETYTLEVFDRYGFASPFHFYELAVKQQAPQFTLSTSADHFTLKAGESLEIELKVNRSGGHSSDIQITAEGLSEGVSAESVTSPTKGDNAKSVKLKLTADKNASFNGQFSISGKSTEDHVVSVDFPLKGQLGKSSLWLTVLPIKPSK